MRIDLEIHQGSEKPQGVEGYFLCWQHCSDRPVVMYWGPSSTDWRYGFARQRVDAWAGPLPERRAA